MDRLFVIPDSKNHFESVEIPYDEASLHSFILFFTGGEEFTIGGAAEGGNGAFVAFQVAVLRFVDWFYYDCVAGWPEDVHVWGVDCQGLAWKFVKADIGINR